MIEGLTLVARIAEVENGKKRPTHALPRRLNPNQPFGILVMQLPQKQRVDHAEDRAVRPDPERERQNSDQAEAG